MRVDDREAPSQRLEAVAQGAVRQGDDLRLRTEHEAPERDVVVERSGDAFHPQLAAERLLAFADDSLQRGLATEQPEADEGDDHDQYREAGNGPADDAKDATGPRASRRRALGRLRAGVGVGFVDHQKLTPSAKWMRVVPLLMPWATSRSSVPTGLRQRTPTP